MVIYLLAFSKETLTGYLESVIICNFLKLIPVFYWNEEFWGFGGLYRKFIYDVWGFSLLEY